MYLEICFIHCTALWATPGKALYKCYLLLFMIKFKKQIRYLNGPRSKKQFTKFYKYLLSTE